MDGVDRGGLLDVTLTRQRGFGGTLVRTGTLPDGALAEPRRLDSTLLGPFPSLTPGGEVTLEALGGIDDVCDLVQRLRQPVAAGCVRQLCPGAGGDRAGLFGAATVAVVAVGGLGLDSPAAHRGRRRRRRPRRRRERRRRAHRGRPRPVGARRARHGPRPPSPTARRTGPPAPPAGATGSRGGRRPRGTRSVPCSTPPGATPPTSAHRRRPKGARRRVPGHPTRSSGGRA